MHEMKAPTAFQNLFIHTPHNVYTLKQTFTGLSISQLKSTIELRTGIPKEHQILQFGSKALSDECLIEETGVKSGSVIRLLFATKIAERIFALANDGDYEGLLRAGVQMIADNEGSTANEQRRLQDWNRNVAQRAFIAVCAASFNGNIQLLANLIKCSAFKINQVTSCGRSALHIAAARGSIGCVCLLLDAGINPCIEDIDGRTAQEIAKDFDHVHCKRRIWLYRWNIKTTSVAETKRCTGVNNDKTIRFPSLDGVSRSSSPRFLDIDDPDNEEEDTLLPMVDSRRNIQGYTSRTRAPRLIEIYPVRHTASSVTEMNSSGSRSSVSSTRTPVKEEDFPANVEENDQEELTMLLSLARKHGYKIVKSKHRTGAECDDRWVERTEEPVTLDASSGDESKSDSISTENASSFPLPNKSDSTENEESRGANKLADLIKRIPIVSKTTHRTKDPRVERKMRTEMYDVEIEKDRLAEKQRQDVLSAVEEVSAIKEAATRTERAAQENSVTKHTARPVGMNNGVMSAVNDARNEVKAKLGTITAGVDSQRDDKSARSANPTFEQWVERKTKEKREGRKQIFDYTSEKEKRQDQCDQAFKKWLQLKRVRYRSASVTPRTLDREDTLEKQRPRSGLNFETWVKKKGKIKTRSLSLVEEKPMHVPIHRAYSCGLSYSEWIETKKMKLKEGQMQEKEATELMKNKPRITGMTFESWVDSKTKQSQIDRVQQENEKLRTEYEREMEKEAKMKDPNVKTFEEWRLEKKFEECVYKAREKKVKKRARKNNIKFEEDSQLIYNMWLLNKHVNEMHLEEERLAELREEWERKRKSERANASSRRTKAKSL